jgi:hypothetical protein
VWTVFLALLLLVLPLFLVWLLLVWPLLLACPPVSSEAASNVAPVACVASGVTPSFGVAASDKDSAPMVISEVAVVAAPISPHEFVPARHEHRQFDSTDKSVTLHGDLDAQTYDFGSPPK